MMNPLSNIYPKTHRNGSGSNLFIVFHILSLLVLTGGQPRAQTPGGSDPHVLFSSTAHHFMAAQWSPDGQFIAFTADNFNGIWLAEADGKNVRLLTADEGAGFGFAWSPDGKLIAARAALTENHRRFHQLKLYDISNFSYEILVDKTRGLYGAPIWSSDGSDISFVRNKNVETIRSQKMATLKGQSPSYTILASHDQLLAYDHAAKSQQPLAGFDGRMIFNLSPSPDGKLVSFQIQGLGLHVMNADGSNLRHIGWGSRASWLPGGSHAVVSVSEDNGYVVTGGELYLVDVTTGEAKHLTAHTALIALNPSVSPCGKWVLFDNPDDGNIYIMEVK
jgi:Tol biopolymer transport system component